MIDHEEKTVDKASFNASRILGMNNSAAGAEFNVTENEDKAKEIIEFRKDHSRQTEYFES